MFKKSLFALSFMALSGAAFSAPIANLKVNGDIKPPTCLVNGGNEDLVFDFGNISPTLIPQNAEYGLPILTQSLNVICDASTYLSYTISDIYPISGYVNQYTSTRHAGVYGLIDVATGKEIGGVAYIITNPTVDGITAYISSAGDTWGYLAMTKNRVMAWTTTEQKVVASVTDLKMMSGKHFAVDIQTNGATPGYSFIKPSNVLAAEGIDISNGLDFVGHAVMNFTFGI